MVSGSRYSSWSFRIIQLFFKLPYLSCLKCVAIDSTIWLQSLKRKTFVFSLECMGGLTLCYTSVYLIFLQRGFLTLYMRLHIDSTYGKLIG